MSGVEARSGPVWADRVRERVGRCGTGWHADGAAQERGSAGAGRAEREGKEVEAGWAEES